jgi:type VI secretion system protein ImpM
MAVGFYGKIPSKGDFIQRRLDRKFTQHWDSWLQSCMENSRAKLGERWLQMYLVSPIWRFALAKNILSENMIVGVVIPSVDSVGRHFPFTLATEITSQVNLYQFAIEQDEWFETLEDLALDGLSEDFNLENFEEKLESYPEPKYSAPAKLIQQTDRRIGWQHEGLSSLELLTSGLAKYVNESPDQESFWWTAGSDNIEPTCLRYNGLPPQDDFAALLSGEWQHG